MELKELGKHLYEENHSPFYVKYYTLSGNFLEHLIRECSLISGNLSIKFSDKYVFFERRQGKEMLHNIGRFPKSILRRFISQHLDRMEALKCFCRNNSRPNKGKILDTFLEYLRLYRGIPSYDFIIHMIWSEKARVFLKESGLSFLSFFEVSCPPQTIVTETYLKILDLIKHGKRDTLKREYGWLYNLEYYMGMSPSEAENRKRILEDRLEARKKKHSTRLGEIRDRRKREWFVLFNELQGWVNMADFNEREIDYHSAKLFKPLCIALGINLETLELVKNLLPEDIEGFKNGSLSLDDLRGIIHKRMSGYLITYSKGEITLEGVVKSTTPP